MNIKPTLYILCGCPGCGKTTFSDLLLYNHFYVRYVSRDDIRFSIIKEDEEYFSHETEVFNRFVNEVYENLTDAYDVIADATHLNKKSRKKLINAIDNRGKIDYQIIFIYFDTPYEICCGRNQLREGRKRVPDEIMKSMWDNFQKPSIIEDERCIGLMLMKGV